MAMLERTIKVFAGDKRSSLFVSHVNDEVKKDLLSSAAGLLPSRVCGRKELQHPLPEGRQVKPGSSSLPNRFEPV
jgi:hypothetical protein